MENISLISRRLSGAVHLALYALMLITPIIGIVTFVYHGRAFDFGFFRIDFGIRSNRSVFHPTEDWHGYLAYALFGIAGFHASAALWHQFVLRDGLLSRMWPRA
jgi:cytochrome b561